MRNTLHDPAIPDWNTMELPDTHVDHYQLWNPWSLTRLLMKVMGRRQRIVLPDNVPGVTQLPRYIFQEFHNVPNGNYSKRLTHGYVTGFDRMMLGTLCAARRNIASQLRDCDSVLDVGTAGGRTAAAIKAAGVREVWGIDPSPYLLQHAARRYTDIHFVQGIAEDPPFDDRRFDGISVCFVMHEIPPKFVRRALHAFARILAPGGKLVICEPAESQLSQSAWSLFKQHGWRGLYFKALAGAVHEPFVRAWHAMQLHVALKDAGFVLLEDAEHFPLNFIIARRSGGPADA